MDICSSPGFLSIVHIFKIVVTAITYIVPIILIVVSMIKFTSATAKGEDELIKAISSFKNILIAAIIVFLVPTGVNLVINLVSSATNYESCWIKSDNVSQIAEEQVRTSLSSLSVNSEINEVQKAIKLTNYIEDKEVAENLKSQLKVIYEEIVEKQQADIENNSNKGNNSNGNNNNTNSTTATKILIVAGHSYSPYCAAFQNECRGKASSGYDETYETRHLAKLLKTKLVSLGYSSSNVDIANILLGEDFNNSSTSKSLYGEIQLNSKALNSIDWSKYKYAIEIHFNAYGSGANGSCTVVSPGYSAYAIDLAITKDLSSIVGTTNRGVYYTGTSTSNFFRNRGIPFTYLETEFYDNKDAMVKYYNNIDRVALSIAKNIQKYYP